MFAEFPGIKSETASLARFFEGGKNLVVDHRRVDNKSRVKPLG